MQRSNIFFDAFTEDVEWKCETNGDGAIKEMSHIDYLSAVEEKINQNDPEESLIPDPPIVGGGLMDFYFRGIRPGLVDLRIVYESPDRISPYVEATYRIAVFSDLKLFALESSVKYDWVDQ